MAAPKIFNAYDEIFSRQLNYCVLCLRTELDRKMVPPRIFSSFLSTLSNNHSFQNLHICYICEAKAVTAMKFVTLVKYALSIDQLFKEIRCGKYNKLRKDLVSQMNGISTEDYPALRTACDCESLFTSMRGSTQMTITEILQITSEGVCRSNVNSKNVGIYIQTDAGTTNKKNSTDNIETVVLDDDDEDDMIVLPKNRRIDNDANKLKTVSVDTNIPINTKKNVAHPVLTNAVPVVLQTGGAQYVLHPIVPGVDGKFYAPTVPINSNNISYLNPNQVTHLTQLVMTNQVVAGNSINIVPETTLKNNTIKANTMNEHIVNKERDNGASDNLHNRKVIIVDNREDVNVMIDNILKDKVIAMENSSKANSKQAANISKEKFEKVQKSITCPARINEIVDEVKKATPSSGRIDWEDKIPMDVISFMDATDPNINNNIMKALDTRTMGLITDVRSEATQETDALIDLC